MAAPGPSLLPHDPRDKGPNRTMHVIPMEIPLQPRAIEMPRFGTATWPTDDTGHVLRCASSWRQQDSLWGLTDLTKGVDNTRPPQQPSFRDHETGVDKRPLPPFLQPSLVQYMTDARDRIIREEGPPVPAIYTSQECLRQWADKPPPPETILKRSFDSDAIACAIRAATETKDWGESTRGSCPTANLLPSPRADMDPVAYLRQAGELGGALWAMSPGAPPGTNHSGKSSCAPSGRFPVGANAGCSGGNTLFAAGPDRLLELSRSITNSSQDRGKVLLWADGNTSKGREGFAAVGGSLLPVKQNQQTQADKPENAVLKAFRNLFASASAVSATTQRQAPAPGSALGVDNRSGSALKTVVAPKQALTGPTRREPARQHVRFTEPNDQQRPAVVAPASALSRPPATPVATNPSRQGQQGPGMIVAPSGSSRPPPQYTQADSAANANTGQWNNGTNVMAPAQAAWQPAAAQGDGLYVNGGRNQVHDGDLPRPVLAPQSTGGTPSRNALIAAAEQDLMHAPATGQALMAPTKNADLDPTARALLPESAVRKPVHVSTMAPNSVLRKFREAQTQQLVSTSTKSTSGSPEVAPVQYDMLGPRPHPTYQPGTSGDYQGMGAAQQALVGNGALDLGMAQRRAAQIGTLTYMNRKQHQADAAKMATAAVPYAPPDHNRGNPHAGTGGGHVQHSGFEQQVTAPAHYADGARQRQQQPVLTDAGPRARPQPTSSSAAVAPASVGYGSAIKDAAVEAAARKASGGLPSRMHAARPKLPQRQGPHLPVVPQMPLPIQTRQPLQVVAPRQSRDLPANTTQAASISSGGNGRIRGREADRTQWQAAAPHGESLPSPNKRRRYDGGEEHGATMTARAPTRRRASVRPDRSKQGSRGWKGRGDPGQHTGLLADEGY